MIDLHAHIIPGVDDGSASMEETEAMLKLAKESGVDTIVATPHFKEGLIYNEDIETPYNKTKVLAAKMGIDLRLGNELYLSEEGVQAAIDGYVYDMGKRGYMLVELPFHQYYPFHDGLMHQLQLKGYTLLLAHVERYGFFRSDPDKLRRVLERGVYGQMNARYVYERKTRKQAFKWIEEGYVHVIASDMHNMTTRTPNLNLAYEALSKQYGIATADLLTKENPARLLEGQALLDVTITKKKKRFGLFKKA